MSNNKNHVKIGPVQIIVFLAFLAGFFTLFQYVLIPRAISGAVVSLFKPLSEDKTPFGRYGTLVWSSYKPETGEKVDFSQVPNKDISKFKKENLRTDFIFDFTFETRNEKEHGYEKHSGEFIVKAKKLGEDAIILETYGFIILSLFLSSICTILISIVMPSSIGLIAALFDEQVDHVKVKVRLQTGFTDHIVNILTMPNKELENYDRLEIEEAFQKVWDRTMTDIDLISKNPIRFEDVYDSSNDIAIFREEVMYNRIKEFFSDFVVSEISDVRDGREWRNAHYKIGAGMRLYMAHHFSEKYSNNVTAAAYGGAAILIIAVGIRGLKFIPANKPSAILLAIFLEFTLLLLMAITLFYTEEEERMDKMLKKMEDANRSQLETLRGQQTDIHQLSTALMGQTSELIKQRVENAISEYLTSGDQVQKQIATAIADKIIFDIKGGSSGSSAQRRK
jgi:hypothetical protein